MKTALNLYFQMHLLLLGTFFIFLLARKVGAKTSYSSLVRIAQILIITSLFSPVVLSLLPQHRMPTLKFGAILPVSESVLQKQGTMRAVLTQKKSPVAVKKDLSPWNLIFEISAGQTLGTLAVGMILMFIRLGRNYRLLRNLLIESHPIRRIGRVTLLVSDSISTPFSVLFGRTACALFPVSLLSSTKDFQIALKHELQHHRQRDTAWAFFLEVLVCVFYPNPWVYLWKREITELQEFSCDAVLIGRKRISPQDYGSTLIKVAEAALRNHHLLVGTTGMAAGSKNTRRFKSTLQRRIEMFTLHKSPQRKKSFAIGFGTFCLLGTITAAYASHQAFSSPPRTSPHPGHATFDPKVQSIAEDALQKAIQSFGAKAGFVLVSDPQTGRLLAVANATRTGQPKNAWALSYRMQPASLMKSIAAAAAVDAGATSFDEAFDCENGTYKYGGHVFHDYKPFGKLTVTDTVVNSSNICGIKIGERLGAAGLEKALSRFGFGPNGVTHDFPEALPGEIPNPTQLTQEEYVALVATGVSAQPNLKITPLEMVQAYGALANGGKVMKPISANAQESEVLQEAIRLESSQGIKKVLEKVVQEGTGRRAQSRLYTTAGKTGTDYTPGASSNPEALGGEKSIASFAGFAPVTNPRVVVYVGIIEPTNSEDHLPHGSEHAAPVFREVTERVLQMMNVPPDKN